MKPKCKRCGGSGLVFHPLADPDEVLLGLAETIICPECDGSGKEKIKPAKAPYAEGRGDNDE